MAIEMKRVRLTLEQEEAVDGILDFLEDDKQTVYKLEGPAGSGKTTIMGIVVQKAVQLEHIHGIYLTAPTNKATKVCKDTLAAWDINGIKARTVHSLLKVKPRKRMINGVMHEIFEKDAFNEDNAGSLRNSFIIIDEASMVPSVDIKHKNKSGEDVKIKSLKTLLYEEARINNVKLLFVGDRYQLPPVGEILTEVLENPEIKLNRVMRQQGSNPLLVVLDGIRKNIGKDQRFMPKTDSINNEDKGIAYYNDTPDFHKAMLSDFQARFDESPESLSRIKALAWTNSQTKVTNKLIREHLYESIPNLPAFLVGERFICLTATKAFDTGETAGDYLPSLYTSDEFIIEKVEKHKLPDLEVTMLFIQVDNSDLAPFYILAVDPIQEKKYKKKLASFKNFAMAEKDPEKKKGHWFAFYRLKEQIAPIDYAYAITVHRSQGSSYETVYVYENNINFNQKILERNQCRYVAMSRATDKVHSLV